jgi:predicted 2-oxoglutarate/Fe(II)-dependent dioxygenase YbiX
MNTLVELPNPAASLNNTGSIYLPESTQFFSRSEWEEIERIANSPELPWEKVVIGDADEPNDVYVARFMTDIDRPRVVNDALAQQMLPILTSERVVSYFQDALGAEKLYVRRVQINRMESGSFIGLHLDQDSNPDYEISIVLQLGDDYQGGAFVVHRTEDDHRTYMTEYRSVLVSRCDLRHEVKRVEGGHRTTLVLFFSRDGGDNPRVRAAA